MSRNDTQSDNRRTEDSRIPPASSGETPEPEIGERDPIRLNVVPGTKPFTRWKAAELILSALIAVLGLIYLLTDPAWIPLSVLLPVYCVLSFAIVVFRWKDAAALGLKGSARFFAVLVGVILALVVAAATAVYFVWY